MRAGAHNSGVERPTVPTGVRSPAWCREPGRDVCWRVRRRAHPDPGGQDLPRRQHTVIGHSGDNGRHVVQGETATSSRGRKRHGGRGGGDGCDDRRPVGLRFQVFFSFFFLSFSSFFFWLHAWHLDTFA